MNFLEQHKTEHEKDEKKEKEHAHIVEKPKKKKRKIPKFLKKKWFWALAIILGFIIIGSIVNKAKPQKVEFSSVQVEKKDLFQTVSETGSVVANLELNYGWQIAGRVVSTTKKVGDLVKKDDIVALLDSTQQSADLREAEAAYSSALAKLNLELVGASEDEIQKSWAAVEKAKADLEQQKANRDKTKTTAQQSIDDAQEDLEDAENDLQLAEGGEDSQIVNDAYEDLINIIKAGATALSDALIEADNVLGIDNTLANDEFEDLLGFQNPTQLNNTKSEYNRVKKKKEDAEQAANSLSYSSSHDDVDAALAIVKNAILSMQSLLYNVQLVLEATLPVGDLSQSELDTLKTGISTDQASINTAGTNLSNGQQAVTTARNSLASYKIAYDSAVTALQNAKEQAAADIKVANAIVESYEAALRQAQAAHAELVNPPRAVDVASLRAEVNKQEANVERFKDELEKTKLKALAEGVISKLDVEVGENVTANQEVLGIVSSQLTVEVDISESEIAKVTVGDIATLTLDAFGDDVEFSGSVLSIEPAETEISGVIYYKTKILIDFDEGRDIRPGMTANVDIMTDKREQVLVIPRRAVIEKEGKKIVRILKDQSGKYEEREVVSGLKGDNGEIEIISGLREGDEVITFLKENGK